MAKPFSELIKDWPAERRAKVDARARELIAEELTLRDLRKARALTQARIAKHLGIGQEHVSRLEKKSDMLLSTLAGYVEAMGGRLRLVAEFPDRPPVAISSLANLAPDRPARTKNTRKNKKPQPRAAA